MMNSLADRRFWALDKGEATIFSARRWKTELRKTGSSLSGV
jgi:hypothetical protein